jgi:hypothetical protein
LVHGYGHNSKENANLAEEILEKYGNMSAQWRNACAALTPQQKRQVKPIMINR